MRRPSYFVDSLSGRKRSHAARRAKCATRLGPEAGPHGRTVFCLGHKHLNTGKSRSTRGAIFTGRIRFCDGTEVKASHQNGDGRNEQAGEQRLTKHDRAYANTQSKNFRELIQQTSKLRKQSSYLHPLWMRTDVLKGLIYPNKGPLTQRQHKLC